MCVGSDVTDANHVNGSHNGGQASKYLEAYGFAPAASRRPHAAQPATSSVPKTSAAGTMRTPNAISSSRRSGVPVRRPRRLTAPFCGHLVCVVTGGGRPMSRVEPKERPVKREAQEGRRQSGERVERRPSQAEGEEREIDEALRNQDRRS